MKLSKAGRLSALCSFLLPSIVAIVCMASDVHAQQRVAEFRNWTTAGGRRSDVRLSVVESSATAVTLKREDNGKTVTLELKALSETDRRYVQEFQNSLDGNPMRQRGISNQNADTAGLRQTVQPFLNQYCKKCHGPETQKAQVRLNVLTPVGETTSGDIWKHILEQIESEAMPPEDEQQPSAAERGKVVQWIRAELSRAEKVAASTGGKVVLRRLNRSEYSETLRRLLHLHPSIDPAESLPEDAAHDGFDNVGSVMTTSARLLEMYLETSERMLNIALPMGPQPQSRMKRQEGEAISQAWIDEYYALYRMFEQELKRLRRLDSSSSEYLEGRDRLAQMERDHFNKLPNDESFLIHRDDLGLASDGRGLTTRQWVFMKPARFGFPSNHPGVYRFSGRIRGEAGSDGAFPTVAISLETVFDQIDLSSTQLTGDEIEFSVETWLDDPLNYAKVEVVGYPNQSTADHPGVWVDWLQIEGPLEASPTPAQVAILGRNPSEPDAPQILERFARQAFRRPVKPQRMAQFVAFYEQRRRKGMTFEMAIRDTLTALLVAPEFLFLLEPKEPGALRQKLDDFELASRLSYFLWSGPPDAELIALAEAGRLSQTDVLRSQIGRMIQHDRAARFAENFAGQWLLLRELGQFEPDPGKYREYNRHLEAAMRRETEQFFLHILREELPIRTLIDSTFTFLNRELARLYGIDGVNGADNEFVRLPANSRRGGLLSHASILTLTSDGVRTSPVKRGTYILEQLLGDPPPPPPPDVPPVPETRGSTLKERLQSHRQLAACAGCHNKIDPLGFALENFNAIGKWREEDSEARKPIDPSGQWEDFGSFSGYREFLTLLLQREDDLQRNLAEKMLVYALGRPIDFSDDSHLETILEKVSARGGKLSTLVTEIALSELFLSK